MEIRECLCGCGIRFKVIKSNTINWFVSYNHAELSKNKPGKPGKAAKSYFDACTHKKKTRRYGLANKRKWYAENYQSEEDSECPE
jgi:phage I-like protein